MHEPKHLKQLLYGLLAVLVLGGCTAPTGEPLRFPKLGDLTASVTDLFESDPLSESNPTAEALYKDGIDYLERGRYGRAISFLQKLRDEYPFSEEAEAAELRIAEAYYLNEEYVEAAETYKNYLTFQPTGRHLPHVKYQLGRVHLDQFNGIDRDLEKVREAKGYFQSVIDDHPESEHVPDAREKLAETRSHLAERELYVGNYYLQEEQYTAARERFENVLRDYADTPSASGARDALTRIPAAEPGAAPVTGQAAAPETAAAAPEPVRFITKPDYEYEAVEQDRWYSYLNPLSWWGRDSEAEPEEAAPPPAAAAVEPAAAEAAAGSTKGVVESVDKALGTPEPSGEGAPRPPVTSLPPEEKESGPTPDDPAAVLGVIDAQLGSGTGSGGAPEAPAADPGLFSARKSEPAAADKPSSDEVQSGLLEGIDSQLRQEGVATPRELPAPPAGSGASGR